MNLPTTKNTIGYVMIGLAIAAFQGVLVYMGFQGGPGAWAPIWMEVGAAYIVTAAWLVTR
jgi:hypothetical protein